MYYINQYSTKRNKTFVEIRTKALFLNFIDVKDHLESWGGINLNMVVYKKQDSIVFTNYCYKCLTSKYTRKIIFTFLLNK